MERNVFIFDRDKCVGCHACVVACMNENGYQWPERWRKVHSYNADHLPDKPLFYLSMACNHCADAPCLEACPASAFSRDKISGIIRHNPDQCIGCKYCSWACPYDAPVYVPSKGIVEKCNFCEQRLEENLSPACVNLCPVGALRFRRENISQEESDASSPVPVSVGISMKITGSAKKKPQMDSSLFPERKENDASQLSERRIHFKEEWPLLLFSLLGILMCSLYILHSFPGNERIREWTVPATGILAFLVSLFHLGNVRKAWKALLNLKTSWLSREILFFSLFLVTSIISLLGWVDTKIPGVAMGFLFLLSLDLLYLKAMWRWKLKIHSGMTTLILAGLITLLYGIYPVFILIILFRKGLLFYHKYPIRKLETIEKIYLLLSITLPGIFIFFLWIYPQIETVLALLIISDILERIHFYTDLRLSDPEVELQKIHQ